VIRPIQTTWNAFLTAVVATLLAGLFVAALPPQYRATAIVKGNPDGMLIVQSGELLAQVMADSGIDASDLYGWSEEWTGTQVEGAALLRQKLYVAAGDEASWIKVSVEGRVAQSTAVLANAIARAYLDRIRQNELTLEVKSALFAEVTAGEQVLNSFLARHPDIVDFRSEKNRLDGELRNIQQRILGEQRKVERIDGQIALARAGIVTTLNDPGVQNSARQRDTLLQQAAGLATRYGAEHMKLREAKAKAVEAETQLRAAFRAAIRRFEVEKAEVRRIVGAIQTEQAKKQAEVDQLLKREQEHQQYRMARQTALDKFNGLTAEEERYEFAEAAVPASTLGVSQLYLLGLVFAGVFLVVQLLGLVRLKMIKVEATGE